MVDSDLINSIICKSSSGISIHVINGCTYADAMNIRNRLADILGQYVIIRVVWWNMVGQILIDFQNVLYPLESMNTYLYAFVY